MTLKTLLNRGLVANDGNGDTPRAGALKINALVSSTYVATQAQFGGATKEATITNTIAAAKADGAKYVRIPQIYDLDGSNMLPYDASLVTFDSSVRMAREGGDPSVYDVQAYGADNTGTSDTSAAFIAAEAGRAAIGGKLRVTSGSYLVNSVVTVSTDYAQWDMDFDAIILDNVTTGPCVQFGVAAQRLNHLRVGALRFKSNTNKFRLPTVQFGQADNGLAYFSVENIWIDLNNHTGDAVWLHTLYNGKFGSIHVINSGSAFSGMGGGVAVVWRNANVNTGNVRFGEVVSNSTPVLFLLQEYYGQTLNQINSLQFDNCKLANASGNTFVAGSTTGAASGATTITVQAGTGANYTIGKWVTLVQLSGGFVTVDQIASINGDILTLTNSAGIPFSMANLDPVIQGNWHTVSGTAVRDLVYNIPHFEQANGIVAIGVQSLICNAPWIGSNCLHGSYLIKSCAQWKYQSPRGVATGSTVVFHVANDSGNVRNSISGASQNDFGGSGTMFQVDGGSENYWIHRYGAPETPVGVFHQDTTVAASQTNVQLTGPSGAVRGVRMRQRGSLVGVVVQTSSARTAGTLTATVFKNGSATALTGIIDGSNIQWIVSDTTNAGIPFVPGDIIDVRVTTDGSWSPTANNLDVTLYVG